MKIIECGTGYTSIPAQMGAATEIVVEELGKAFKKNNINYVIYDIEDEQRAKTNLNIHEVKVLPILRNKDTTLGLIHKLKRVFYSLSLAKELRKEIKRNEDKIVIHFHNQYNMYFFLKTTSKKFLKNVKIVYTVHSYIWNNDWEDIKGTIRKKYFQEVYCVRNADKVFVLNNITIDHFVNELNVKKEKIIKIDNGVNIEVYYPINDDINKEDIVFFQSGSVCPRKNQLSAIKNLSTIIKKQKNIKYLYAGGIIDSDYKNQIDNYILDNEIKDNIEYAGELKPGKELNLYYNKAKAFIFPSMAEAFSLVILEALSCGLPVIMDRNAIKEVDDDLENIILFYKNENEFNEIIEKCILDENIRKNIAKDSRKLIEKKYSWEVVAKKYFEIMSGVI